MANCPVTVERIPDSKGETWRITPSGWAHDHGCKVRFLINGHEVTGTGDFGIAYVSGKGFDFIRIEPPPAKSGSLRIEVDCPDCNSTFEKYIFGTDGIGIFEKVATKIAAVIFLILVGPFGLILMGLFWILFWPLGVIFGLINGPGLGGAIAGAAAVGAKLWGDFVDLLKGAWDKLWN